MSQNNKAMYDAVIIGGGPAGLTAAIYLARAYYRVLVIEKENFGGQIRITSEVVNYPGVEHISGAELGDHMKLQAMNFGAEFLLAEVESIEPDGDIKRVKTSRGTFESFGIVIATGARPRMIGFEGEEAFKGHGVAYCATCDGEFFTGKDLYVVGGGFAAAEESVFLTKYASHVTVLVREDDFTCARSTAKHAYENEKITVLTNTEVVRIEGDELPRSITYRNNKTGEENTFKTEDTFGVFVFAGYEPATDFLKPFGIRDERGYIITDRSQKTDIEGIYAAGDVCIKPLRQVVTAVGDAALAATELEKHIAKSQQKTGIRPERPVRQSGAGKSGESKRADRREKADGGALFTPEMLSQLDTVFSKMSEKVVLKLYLDERAVSGELEHYMDELCRLTDKLEIIKTYERQEYMPKVAVCRADKTESGLAFHGVPGGHEFTSFILGLYNVAGPGQPVADDIRSRIESIDVKTDIRILVSLTCTMCPELVLAAQRIAALNPNVSAEIFDINHFGELKEKYNVMSVPCMIINDGKPSFGKKNIEQILEMAG